MSDWLAKITAALPIVEERMKPLQDKGIVTRINFSAVLAFHVGAVPEPLEHLATMRRSFFASLQNMSRPIGSEADLNWEYARSRRPPETELRTRLRDLANERRRFGYRRLFILLQREGEPSGVNRIYRLYREEDLTVRKRRARRRAVGTRAPILVEAKPNARWSLDFVHDQFACGRRFRVLNIVDDVTRECLAAIPDTSISGRRVARELTDRRGKPDMIVSDHCTEFTANAILAGRRIIASNGTTSRRASRCKMATSNPSTAECATSC